MPEIILEESAEADYYRKLAREFPNNEFVQSIIKNDLKFMGRDEASSKDDTRESEDMEETTATETKFDQVHFGHSVCQLWFVQDQTMTLRVKQWLMLYSRILSGDYDHTSLLPGRKEDLIDSLGQYQSEMFYSTYQVFSILTGIVIVFGLLTSEYIFCLGSIFLGSVLLRQAAKGIALKKAEVIHKRNLSTIIELDEEFCIFHRLIRKALNQIRDIEAVAKGYRLSLPRAPISRIEVQQNNVSFHSMKLRKLVAKSLRSVIRTIETLFEAISPGNIRNYEENRGIENSIEFLKNLLSIALSMQEDFKDSVKQICRESERLQFFGELSNGILDVLCLQLEHQNQELSRYITGRKTVPYQQFQIEANVFCTKMTDLITELSCQAVLFKELCDKKEHDLDDVSDLYEKQTDMVEQVEEVTHYIRVIGKGLLSAHFPTNREESNTHFDHTEQVLSTITSDDRNLVDLVPVETYELLKSDHPLPHTQNGIEGDVLNVYEMDIQKEQPEIPFLPKVQLGLPSLTPAMLNKFGKVVKESEMVAGQPLVDSTSTQEKSTQKNKRNLLLGELQNVMRNKTRKQHRIRTTEQTEPAPQLL